LGHRGITQDEKQKSIGKITEWLGTDPMKIGANPLYDMDWLTNWLGIPIKGQIVDIQGVEAMLDEYKPSYSLDSLAKQYLGVGKGNDEIKAWCDARGYKDDPRKHLYEMPYETVRKYAISDVRQPLAIFRKQEEQLREQDLGLIFDMECALLPLLSRMRKNGLRIDRARRKDLSSQIKAALAVEQRRFTEEFGSLNIKSGVQMAKVFDARGWTYPRTPKGSPCFDKLALETMDNDFSRLVLSMREKQTMLGNFLEGAWVDHDVNGRIHCNFLPLRKDEGGTVTGRFSSQNPNLQQVSADHGKEHPFSGDLRSVFVPEEGCWYGGIDYSQIEYRFIAHYARGPGADQIKQKYNADPNTDYHKLIMDMTGVDRSTAKRLNFGMAYFMGARSMSKKFKWTLTEAQDYVTRYLEMVPFINETRYAVVDRAKTVGYIRTIMGRRARMSEVIKANKKEYVAFNRLIQGSAADLMKKGMVDADKAGIFDVLTPHITVHDELGVSVPKTLEGIEAYEELKRVMETALKLRVPIIAAAEYGTSWGTTKDCHEKGTDPSVFSAMRRELQ
jgi:DNA polymerase I-like protein with 3'-5' exonuclease and polymerase domains